MPDSKFVKGVWIEIGKVGDHEVGINNVAHDAIANHARVSIFVGALDFVFEFFRFQNVLYDRMKQ